MKRVAVAKQGFTMIELIFVIVILGILSAVAIPKLSATRTDAEISKMSASLKAVISDLTTAFVTTGELRTWDDATMTRLMLDEDTTIADDTDVTTPVYLYNGDKQCIKFVATKEGNITISKGSNTTDKVCSTVQEIQSNLFDSIILSGVKVKY